ncbi:RNA-splicing ligase RtcB [Janthinobacterium sp. HH103]|uniref:RtcB family protein n=1 Tax=unclassified Janthinobacterium TaxID=2610881 RepID=UPI0008751203|nr:MULTISPECIES: RtcB family protein [unclassified Janthinobacterium]OEZ67544.1 RNA-splicing ligase RtcB [Janthinobacterium sp. HH100]OEZ74395.1 RNA-splicing ligase RtcB [Janthinobacterium sp. HH103]QOU71404.1 RNA-splicing ligase RtcB [Janthinobacterium sp. HH102]
MPIHQTLRGAHVPVHIFTDDIDAQALRQLHNIASLPIVHPHVAAMPDVHAGIGATVGSVIPTRAAIIPAAVGVDIGCGMNAVRTTLTASDLPDNLARLRSAIEAEVPVGFEQHAWSRVQGSRQARAVRPLGDRLAHIVERHRGIAKMLRQFERTWICQAGTLGGGNHFIEICLDEEQRVWIMLHSGSRGIGNVIGRYFISAAQKDMRRHQLQLPDADLAYLSEGSTVFDDYVEAVDWAQDYALLNRSEMMRRVLDVLAKFAPPFRLDGEAINCHHNYIARETHGNEDLYVTRKGAISARQGELGIIPGSMGARSFIVRGKGKPESFCSCSHGAGRSMSRSEAKRRFNRFDLAEQTAGIECRKDGGVIDEIPAAYKNIDAVMVHQSDLVEVVHTLRQVVCIKG